MRIRLILITIFVAATTFVSAQVVIDTTNPIQFGVFGHIGQSTMQINGISQLVGYKKPYSLFQNSNGESVSFGGEINAPLSSMMKATLTTASIHAGIRLGFNVGRAQPVAEENTLFIVNGVPTPGVIRYTLEARFSSIGLEPMVEFTPPFHDNIRIHAGLRTAWVYAANFTQIESISSPSTVEFIHGSQQRMKYEGEVPTYSKIEVAALVGLSYNINLSKRFSIVPEMFYQVPINNHTTDADWDTKYLRMGISVRVVLPTTKPTVKDTLIQRDTITKAIPDIITENTEIVSRNYRLTINEADDVRYEFTTVSEHYLKTIPKAKPILTASINTEVYQVFPDSSVIKLDTLVCDEIVWNDFHPLLNYVFFEENSSKLQVKYNQLRTQDVAEFKSKNDETQMETYYNMMNIIAQGLSRFPKSKITINGCTSKKEFNSNPDWKNLAKERADVVAKYFSQNWNIEPSRLNITYTGIPKKPSNEKNDDGSSENQRVEIYSENEELLEPVMLRDTLLESDVAQVRIFTNIKTGTPINSWVIRGEQDRKVIFSQTGLGVPPDSLDVILSRNIMRRLIRNDTATFNITVTLDQQGKGEVKDIVKIPMVVRQIEKLRKQQMMTEVDRYILMLFDFGKDNLTTANEKVVDYIKQRIDKVANVSIIGTTDRSGNPEYNRKLSLRRAQSVNKILQFAKADIVGQGIDIVTYDNDLPEGRFHARTVLIEVEHSKKISGLIPY